MEIELNSEFLSSFIFLFGSFIQFRFNNYFFCRCICLDLIKQENRCCAVFKCHTYTEANKGNWKRFYLLLFWHNSPCLAVCLCKCQVLISEPESHGIRMKESLGGADIAPVSTQTSGPNVSTATQTIYSNSMQQPALLWLLCAAFRNPQRKWHHMIEMISSFSKPGHAHT